MALREFEDSTFDNDSESIFDSGLSREGLVQSELSGSVRYV